MKTTYSEVLIRSMVQPNIKGAEKLLSQSPPKEVTKVTPDVVRIQMYR